MKNQQVTEILRTTCCCCLNAALWGNKLGCLACLQKVGEVMPGAWEGLGRLGLGVRGKFTGTLPAPWETRLTTPRPRLLGRPCCCLARTKEGLAPTKSARLRAVPGSPEPRPTSRDRTAGRRGTGCRCRRVAAGGQKAARLVQYMLLSARLGQRGVRYRHNR